MKAIDAMKYDLSRQVSQFCFEIKSVIQLSLFENIENPIMSVDFAFYEDALVLVKSS